MLTILVTGATGFVGRHLVPALVALGHRVKCAVSERVDWLAAEQIPIGRLEMMSDWTSILQGVDVVIHLAAKVHVMQKGITLDDFVPINVMVTQRLSEQAAACGVKRFIFMSTIKVNGESTDAQPFTEQDKPQPLEPYAQSKLAAEQILLSLSQNSAMEIVIIRPCLIFGPGVKANFLKMVQLVRKGWPLPFGRVQNKRSFIFIDNLVSALCLILQAPEAANQIYLLADDEAWSLSSLLQFLAQQLQVKSRLFPVPGLVFALQCIGLSKFSSRLLGSLEVSNHKIKSHLGWVPPVSSADGLMRTVQWYQNEYNT